MRASRNLCTKLSTELKRTCGGLGSGDDFLAADVVDLLCDAQDVLAHDLLYAHGIHAFIISQDPLRDLHVYLYASTSSTSLLSPTSKQRTFSSWHLRFSSIFYVVEHFVFPIHTHVYT